MSFSIVPRLSAYDPAADGEGSLDPLGLDAAAEHLADQLLPGMTARMSRIRALTFMAVSAHVTHPFVDEYTADQRSPAFIVFEWMYAEAMVAEDANAYSIPGIQKTAKILQGGGHLAAQVYLKSPRALGLHGFYRRLARATGVIDASDLLDESGEELIRAWEKDQGLEGFYERTGPGGKALNALRSDLDRGLQKSRCHLRPTSTGGLALRRNLTPDFEGSCSRERRTLRRLLVTDDRRGETLEHLQSGLTAQAFDGDEQEMAEWIRRKGSPELASSAEALLAFENVVALLTDAFNCLRWRATESQMLPRRPEELLTARHEEIAEQLPRAMARLSRASADVPGDDVRHEVEAAFSGVRSSAELAGALLERHYTVQERKGRAGKRPWFERTERGVAVRPGYSVHEEPRPVEGFLHPSRLSGACEFLEELA